MDSEELRTRTKKYAAEVIRFVDNLPKGMSFEVMGKQLLRSATSTAANYRAACRARSKPDFINKLGIVEEEADETVFWLEMLLESKKIPEAEVRPIMKEGQEILSIFSAAHKTARVNRNRA
jgi:four helix bundle protein